MKKLAVGVIGCGALARATHLPHLTEMEGARLKWACDTNATTLDEVARQFLPERITGDYADVTNDPDVDAVVLATTQEVRLPIIEAAAKAGKGIYCEKPIANTVAEMEQVQRIVEDARVAFCVGHNRRSAPAMIYAREVFQRQRRQPAPCPWRFDRNSMLREHWPEEDQAFIVIRVNDDVLSWMPWVFADTIMAHGPMLFEMTHFVDIACWCAAGRARDEGLRPGSRPVRVTSVGHHRANHDVVIEFDDGSLATILMTGVGTFGYPKELYEMYCGGSVVVMDHFVEVRTAGMEGVAPRQDFRLLRDPLPDVADGGGIRDFYAKRRRAEQKAMESGDPQTALALQPVADKGHKQHLAAFLDAVRGNGESPCPCADSIAATRIAFAAVESLKIGRAVEL
jgi:predicted dehydrogenase